MANSMQANQAVNAAAIAVVAANPDIAAALRSLITDVINYQRYVMRHGSPNEKLALVKAMVPQMLNAMSNVDAGEQDKERREAYERMLAEMRGDVTTAS